MNWLVPLPVALPLLVAAGLVGAAPVCRRRIADSIAILTSAAVVAACVYLAHASGRRLIVYWFGDWLPRGNAAIGISFAIDPLGAGVAGFSALLVTAALVYAWEYFDAVRTYFHALMLIFLAAMTGFSLTGDLFNLFVFFELMSVVAYALTGYQVEEISAIEGAINFAVTNSIGAFLMLVGIGLVYGRTGALNLAQAGQALAQRPADALVVVAWTAMACGFFIKAAVVPFHFWLADAHAVAPTPVCVLFSGVMIELGLYGAFRVYWTVFHPAFAGIEARLRLVLLGLGAVTAVVGAILCFAQRHLKRLLAFSSISHIGMMLAGAASLSPRGIAGTALYLLSHGCVKGALFMCTGILLHRLRSVDEMELFGRGRKFFWLGITFALGGLGLAGSPPYLGSLGKELMEQAGAALGEHWLAWMFLFCSALTGGAVLRAAGMVFLGWGESNLEEQPSPTARQEEQETRTGHRRIPGVMLSAAMLLMLAPLLCGFVQDSLASGALTSARRFVSQEDYAAAVLRGRAPARPGVEAVRPTLRGVLSGLGGAVAAVAVALTALFRKRFLPPLWRSLEAASLPLINGLRRFHTGHIGDLVAWLLIGAALTGFGFLMAWRW